MIAYIVASFIGGLLFGLAAGLMVGALCNVAGAVDECAGCARAEGRDQ